MSFTPKFNIGQAFQIKNYIPSFSAQNTSGIRRSKATNTLVIICNHTKSLYDDKWYGNILHYTGQGKKGDQPLQFTQNRTLSESDKNGAYRKIILLYGSKTIV